MQGKAASEVGVVIDIIGLCDTEVLGLPTLSPLATVTGGTIYSTELSQSAGLPQDLCENLQATFTLTLSAENLNLFPFILLF